MLRDDKKLQATQQAKIITVRIAVRSYLRQCSVFGISQFTPCRSI